MKCFVPYDGTELAVAALKRAEHLAGETEEIIVTTVVPGDRDYAVERGWIDENEGFDADTIEARLEDEVTDLAPSAEFRCLTVSSHVTSGGIATRLRDVATEIEADVVFLGSENVGSIAAPVSSIGSNVATRVTYDIYLVQNR